MEISNKKVLITGGMGFIGSNLAAKLVNAGNSVTLVSLIPEYGGNTRNHMALKIGLMLMYQMSVIHMQLTN